jgi:ubiquinone/menaquinone biosynthesis C-methylase UbiE
MARRIFTRIRHPFSRWERLYANGNNPWEFDAESELWRIAETNRIILKNIGRVSRLLEIGSAEGHQTAHLFEVADTVHGIDPSKIACERATQRVPQATFSVGVFPHVTIDGHYDLAACFETIYYVPTQDIPRAIAMMERVADKRIVSVYYKHKRFIEQYIYPRALGRETIYWDGNPRWYVAWW